MDRVSDIVVALKHKGVSEMVEPMRYVVLFLYQYPLLLYPTIHSNHTLVHITKSDEGGRRRSSRLTAKSSPSNKAAPRRSCSRNSGGKKSNKGKSSMSTAADKVCQHFFLWFVFLCIPTLTSSILISLPFQLTYLGFRQRVGKSKENHPCIFVLDRIARR